jgi:hypothetical protein
MYAIEIAGGAMMYTYQVPRRLVQAFKQYYGFASEIREALMLVLLV